MTLRLRLESGDSRKVIYEDCAGHGLRKSVVVFLK